MAKRNLISVNVGDEFKEQMMLRKNKLGIKTTDKFIRKAILMYMYAIDEVVKGNRICAVTEDDKAIKDFVIL